jgi:hyperosmotically inducible periplasmic protein
MRTRNNVPFYLSAAMGGAALAYFLDPQSGRRRRHQSRDQLLSVARNGTKRARKLVHHATADAAGTARRAAHALRRPEDVELDDTTLVDKVESTVFRTHDVPKGQINVNAENGVVFLRGTVESSELVETLEARVRKVRGVKDVENLLHTAETSAS